MQTLIGYDEVSILAKILKRDEKQQSKQIFRNISGFACSLAVLNWLYRDPDTFVQKSLLIQQALLISVKYLCKCFSLFKHTWLCGTNTFVRGSQGSRGQVQSIRSCSCDYFLPKTMRFFSQDFKEVLVNCRICLVHANKMVTLFLVAAVEQWVIAFAPQAEGLVFESQLLQT